jgi:hypothetical protein
MRTDVSEGRITSIFWAEYQCSKKPMCSRSLATRWFLARLIFGPEAGGEMYLRNTGSRTDCTTLYSRRSRSACRCFPVGTRDNPSRQANVSNGNKQLYAPPSPPQQDRPLHLQHLENGFCLQRTLIIKRHWIFQHKASVNTDEEVCDEDVLR